MGDRKAHHAGFEGCSTGSAGIALPRFASSGTSRFENNRRAKFYSLTAAGRKQLKSELDNWHRLSSAIGLVIETA
jgi:hypothetical protein